MNNGIVAAVIALLLGSQQKQWQSGTSAGKGWMEPVEPTPTPSPSPGVTTLDDSFNVNKRPTGAILVDIPAPTPAPISAPVSMTPIRNASTGWRWFTPGGVIESRPPTEDEKDLGCPEVPGIWDMSRNAITEWKRCANPDCASNNRGLDLATGNYLEPTPAVLNQEVDKATGQVSYYCPVCRNRTT